jgi:anaerobic selenocysteine-containing dehydrogenase
MSYWQNYPKFHVSLMKAWYGPAATAENNWAYDYLPKLDKQYDMLQVFELMNQGKVNGYIAQGFNPLAALSNKDRVRDGLAKLKFLVIMDPLATETSEFWKNHGEFNDVETDKIQTDGVPPAHHLLRRRRGAVVSSSRVLQWHWKAPSRRARRTDIRIMSDLHLRLREMYAKDGGKFPTRSPSSGGPMPSRGTDPEEWPRSTTAGAGGPVRSQGPDQGDPQGRRAAGRLRRAARRRHHPRRLLDLLGRWTRRATRWRAATTPTRRASATR